MISDVRATRPRRDVAKIILVLVPIVACGWGYFVFLQSSGIIPPAQMGGGASVPMSAPSTWSAAYGVQMFAMWVIMMIATMLPSTTSAIRTAVHRIRNAGRTPGMLVGVTLFSAGYILVWSGFSALATLLQRKLD